MVRIALGQYRIEVHDTRTKRPRRILHYWISPRFLINTIRSENMPGARDFVRAIYIEFHPLKSASLISVRTSDARHKNVPRAYDKRLTRSFILCRYNGVSFNSSSCE